MLSPSSPKIWLALASVSIAVSALFILDILGNVDNEWFAFHWYLLAALLGLLVGGPVAQGLRPKDYEERPIRQVGSGMGM